MMDKLIYAIGGILLAIIGVLSAVITGKNRKIDKLKETNDALDKQDKIHKANREAMDEVRKKQESVDTSGDIDTVIARWNGVQDGSSNGDDT